MLSRKNNVDDNMPLDASKVTTLVRIGMFLRKDCRLHGR
jgi:hypothetical protein